MKSALLLLALGCGLAGCVDDDLSLTIVKFAAITSDTMCQPSTASPTIQTGGLLDVGIANAGASQGYHGYFVAPVVQNNLIERATMTSGETDAIDLIGFDVQLIPDAGDPQVGAAINGLPAANRNFFYSVAGGRLPPGGMTQVAVSVEVVNIDTARVLASAITTTGSRSQPPILVHIRPVGMRAGLRLNGGWIDFPLRLCKFCLNTPSPLAACPAAGFPAATFEAGGCFPEMDTTVSCCTDPANNLLCGAQAPKMTTTM